jgi:3-phosphoshikimate 1-carboxyvinyltransferase
LTVVKLMGRGDHTERLLSHFGATIERQGLTVSLKGGQMLYGQELRIPGDPSSAAFPAVLAAACSGSEVQINHICLNPTRIGFIAPLKRMGADIELTNVREEAGDTVGDIVVRGKGLRGTRIAGDEIPWLIDELPVLIAAAALAEGRTEIRDARELRVKESDRIAAMAAGLRALGGEVSELEDGIRLHDGAIATLDDHRIAMSFYVLGRAAGINVAIDKPDCVVISYPNFFSDMEGLR